MCNRTCWGCNQLSESGWCYSVETTISDDEDAKQAESCVHYNDEEIEEEE